MITLLKYTFDELKIELSKYGFNLIEYISTTELISIDSNGYKYKINLCNLRKGCKPNRFMKNPFALYNFNLYLKIHHPNYELLETEYLGCKTKMRFICHKHINKGVRLNTIDNIVNNHHACLFCGCEDLWERKRTPINKIINECKRVGVQYVERISKNNECWVNYICPNHKNIGVQSTSWTHFKELENGCPHCNKMSKGESRIYNFLTANNIKFNREYCFDDCIYKRHLKFDFYIPILNLVIEYNGQQHYKPIKIFGDKEKYENTIKRDNIKINYCKKNNIKMFIIPFWDYDNIEKLLEPFIEKALLLSEKA